MGCLKLDYYEDLQVRAHERTRSGEAKMELCWLSVDPLAEKGPEYSPYSFCFNNPMHFTDPDGRWPDFPASFQNAFKGAVNGVVNSVKQKYNEAKSSVSRSYNQAKTSLVQAKDNAVKTTKQALNDGQKWVKDNMTVRN